MPEYAFDLKLFAAIRVKADSEEQARAMLTEKLDCASCNAGEWDNGDPILFEASPDGSLDLFEIDGKPI